MERSPIEWALTPPRKFAVFEGRARRSEYWWYTLLLVAAAIVAAILDAVLGTSVGGGVSPDGVPLPGFGILYLLVILASIIRSLAVGVRRLHDRDKSGWWLLLGLVPLIGGLILLVWYVSDGTPGANRFGADPKGRTALAAA